MGQAKKRGSFEDRVAQAIQKKELAEEQEQESIREAKEKFLKLWDSWTDEERDAFRKKRKAELKKKQELGMLLSMVNSFTAI